MQYEHAVYKYTVRLYRVSIQCKSREQRLLDGECKSREQRLLDGECMSRAQRLLDGECKSREQRLLDGDEEASMGIHVA